MLFKFSLGTTTAFVNTFFLNAKAAEITILDNELSNTKLKLPVSRIDAELLSKMFNSLTHKLMEDAYDVGKQYVYINLRVFIENYEAALSRGGYEATGYNRERCVRTEVL